MTPLRLHHQFLSFALAAVVTLGLLAGVSGVADHQASSGLAAQAQAQVQLAASAARAPAV